MIRCTIVTQRGLIQSFESTGHGSITNTEAKVSISCAAVSSLIRSMGILIEQSEYISIGLEKFQPGEIKLLVHSVHPEHREWFRGICDMCIQGLEDVRRDFPDQIEIFRTDERE